MLNIVAPSPGMVFVDRTGGDEARHEAIRAHTIQQFGDLAETACGILDEPVESGPALGLLLSLAERGVPPEVLACLDIERIDRLAQLTESQPVLGACCLTMLAERLGALAPSETVEDIFDYLFRNSTLRSLERSLVRAGVRAPGTCRVGGEWRHDFRRWRDSILRALQDFRWLGSGHDARGLPAYDVDPAIMRGSAMATPGLNFTRSGKTGWLLAMVYAGSLYDALPAPLCPRLATPFEPGSTPRGATSQGADLSRGVSSTGSRGRVETSLHTAGHVLAEISRQMSAMGAGLPGRILSVLEYVSTYVQIPLLPGAQGASLPADREIWTTLVSSLPAQSNTTTALPRPSPEIKRLTESANVWRQRAALHGELSHRFEALLHFEPPVSEEALFEARLASRPELAGVNLSELTLRRHSRAANHQRLVKVRYWPLLVAAREIAEGKLDIVSPRDGVSFDVCLPTPAGAIYETPSLMGAERFHALVTDWRDACRNATRVQWTLPGSVAELAVSPLTTRLATGLAASDLALAYDNGLLTRRALLLGMRELSRAGAASSASSASFAHANSPAAPRAYRLTLAFTDAGKAHREAAAGVAVLCERPMNGTTLLYMRGDPMAWRGFDSPQALLEDVRNNVAGLGDRLAQRLPAVAAQRARIGAVSAALQDGKGASLAELTSHTILDVVRADTPLSAAAAGTGARIAAYRRWLAGADAAQTEAGVRELRSTYAVLGRRLPGAATLMSATEVHDVTHLQSLRNRVSAAVPRLRHEANGFAAERLAQLGYIHADPERVYVMIEGKHSALPVTDAVVHMLEVPGARVDDGQGLFERDADGKLRSMTLRTFPHARPLSASTLLNAESNEAFIGRLIQAYDTFWHHARADVRKVVKSEFLAQVWWQRATRHMSVEQVNLAARVAGPIELRRLADASLSLEIDAPNARREWLRVMGHDSNLMTVSVDGRDPLLLIALYDDGLTVHGFNDRGALVRWYAAQTQNGAGRKRLLGALHTNATMTADDLAGSRIDADTRSETAPVDTFTLLEAAYESQRHTATENPTPASRSRTALLLMRTLSHIDLAFGVATWCVPGARMASLGLSVADAGVGVLGLAVAAADGDSELRNQGWQSLLSAIGAQGIAAAQYRTLGLLTGDAKYRYFVMDKPIASESLIPGLYRGNGQLYAGVDRMTRAYVEFDMQTGFFRAVLPRSDARRPAKPGPLMRLTSGGHWRTVTQPAETTPPLDDPFIAWRIDQGFRARHDALRDSRDALFQQARRAVAAGPAAVLPEAAAARQWYLRLLKLEFMDSAEQDLERLGTLAGRIDEVENAVEAGLCSAISALAEEAHNIGARYLAITQRPRTYFSHVRTGLTRATALAAHYGPVHTIATRFNGMARLPPIVSESFMQDLGELGEASVPYLPKPFGIAPSRRLIDVFEGPSDTRRAFELTAGTRTLLLGRSFDESGVAQYYFMDPNVGLVIHNDLEALIGIVKTHLDAMAQTYGIARPTTTLAIEAAELDIDYLANMNWLNNVEEIIPLREAFDV